MTITITFHDPVNAHQSFLAGAKWAKDQSASEVERLKEVNRLLANKNADCELRIAEAVKAERTRIFHVFNGMTLDQFDIYDLRFILNPTPATGKH